jgi:hypothetical protein
MKFFTNRKENVKPEVQSVQEETVSERQTTKIGYVMLFLMVVFVVGIAQTIFFDLGQLVAAPDRPDTCVQRFADDNYVRTTVPVCSFGEIDSQMGIDRLITDIKPTFEQVVARNVTIDNLEDDQRRLEREIVTQERAYELSLQETIADEQELFEANQIQLTISQLRNDKAAVDTSLASTKNNRAQLVVSYAAKRGELRTMYDFAEAEYDRQYGWYRFQVFLLMLVFVVPFFAVTTRYYLKLKRANSPHTIIAGAAMIAAALLFLQVVLLFLYEIIPSYWIEVIFSFFLSMPLLRYVLYYGSIVVIIGVFGGIVYFIQKRIYDPLRVARRALKHSQCPRCDFSITRHDTYCANCALVLRHECHVCSQSRSSHLPVCATCGDDSRVVADNQQ